MRSGSKESGGGLGVDSRIECFEGMVGKDRRKSQISDRVWKVLQGVQP